MTENTIRKQLESRQAKIWAKLEPLQKEYDCTLALLATLDEHEKAPAHPAAKGHDAPLPDMLKVRR